MILWSPSRLSRIQNAQSTPRTFSCCTREAPPLLFLQRNHHRNRKTWQFQSQLEAVPGRTTWVVSYQTSGVPSLPSMTLVLMWGAKKKWCHYLMELQTPTQPKLASKTQRGCHSCSLVPVRQSQVVHITCNTSTFVSCFHSVVQHSSAKKGRITIYTTQYVLYIHAYHWACLAIYHFLENLDRTIPNM